MFTNEHKLEFYDFKAGEGRPVEDNNTVEVHFRIALSEAGIEDSPLDDSWQRNLPIRFTVGQETVLEGVDKGIIGMREASHRRIKIPPELAFGKRGVPGRVPPNAVLFVEVYLVQIL